MRAKAVAIDRRRIWWWWLAGALGLGLMLASPAWAGGARHSGSLAAVDPQAGTIVLDEVGPWKVRNGATVVTKRTIAVPADATLVIVRRAPQAPSGYANDWVEERASLAALKPGAFVTAETESRDGRLVAMRVVVATPDE
jgi:hypothetical protein